jgi:hypothetical protein
LSGLLPWSTGLSALLAATVASSSGWSRRRSVPPPAGAPPTALASSAPSVSSAPSADIVAANDSFGADAATDRVVVADIAHFKHPTRAVFETFRLVLERVELLAGRTYPVFFVRASPREKIADLALLTAVAEKNGYWDFAIDSAGVRVAVVCDKTLKRVVSVTTDGTTVAVGPDPTAEKGAIDLLVRSQKLVRDPKTGNYAQKGLAYELLLMPQGFDDKGRFEIRLCPDYYPLSGESYYVDLKTGSVSTDP